MTPTQMEVVSTLADLQSFTATAAHMGVSQSAVSQSLGALERELGVKLFDRRGAQVTLSEIGARLLPRIREMRGLSDTIRQEAKGYKSQQIGQIKIGSFGPSSTIHLLPPLLEAFQNKHPDVDLYIDEGSDGEVLRWLAERRVDIGVVTLPNKEFDTIEIARDALIAVLPKDMPTADPHTISPTELASHPFMMTEAGSGKAIEAVFQRAGVTPNIRFRTSQVLSTLSMVAQGKGVAILAELALPPQLGNEGYKLRRLSPISERRIGLAMSDETRGSPASKALFSLARRKYAFKA